MKLKCAHARKLYETSQSQLKELSNRDLVA